MLLDCTYEIKHNYFPHNRKKFGIVTFKTKLITKSTLKKTGQVLRT